MKTILTLHNKTKVESVPPGREYLILAKHVTNITEQYFLKVIANRLISPLETTRFELRKNDSQFVKVSKEVYDKYHEVINGVSKTPLRSLEVML